MPRLLKRFGVLGCKQILKIMAKVQLPVRIEKKDFETLKNLAELDNRPLSNYVDTVLKNHIKSKK